MNETPWLPNGFEAPHRAELLPNTYHLRPIHPDDTALDMIAFMGSQERLWSIYGRLVGPA